MRTEFIYREWRLHSGRHRHAPAARVRSLIGTRATLRRCNRQGLNRQGARDTPRASTAKYTNKQERQAEHIEGGYEDRGVAKKEAKRRAWATVNAMTGGGKKSGSGRGKRVNKAPAKKGGRIGGRASAKRSAAAKSRSAKKAVATRKRRSR